MENWIAVKQFAQAYSEEKKNVTKKERLVLDRVKLISLPPFFRNLLSIFL